jgi:selenocysteine lyase/cysteine desulfurase
MLSRLDWLRGRTAVALLRILESGAMYGRLIRIQDRLAPRHLGEAGTAGSPERLISVQRAAFNVPEEIAYFNTASLAPQLRVVREAGEAALGLRGRPWAISSSDWFRDVERLRTLFARLVGASAEGVAIVPATSYGFAVAARNLPLRARRRVLVLADEYPSGIYTWRAACRRSGAELLTVSREPGESWTDAVLGALDERVAIVSVPNVHWTDGALLDLATIAQRSRELGAALVIDGSQSVGAMPTDVAALRPDFLVTVGYKWLLGPFSVGYLYVAERHRDGEPLEQNWINRAGAEDFAALVDYRDDYQPGARRFDSGQRTKFELIPMAIAALEQILAWQVPAIAATLSAITAGLAQRMSGLSLNVAREHERGPHMLGLGLPKHTRARASAALAQADCYAAFRGASLRISPHLHTTEQDIGRLLDALAGVADPTAGTAQP